MQGSPTSRTAPGGATGAPRGGARAALAVAVGLLLCLAGAASPAVASAGGPSAGLSGALPGASGDVAWSLTPADGPLGTGRANFAYEVAPGDVLQDAVVVTNLTDAPLTLDAYATDAFTTSSGHLDLLPAGAAPADLGAWLTLDLPARELVVEPRAAVTVPFTLTVPADAAPGDHSGGVVTSYLSAATGSTVARDNRLALRVHARVAGELVPGVRVDDVRVQYRGTANPFGAGRAVVTYTLTNAGNARLLPSESVTVAGPGGVGTRTVVLPDAQEVLAGSVVRRTVEVDGVLPAFRLEAAVAVTGEAVGIGGGDLAADRATAAGAAVPWAALAVVLAVVGGAVLVGLRDGRARGATTSATPAPDASVPATPARAPSSPDANGPDAR